MTDEVVDHVARARMDAHEDICAQRYGELQTALKTLNDRTFNIGGAIIVLLIGALAAFIAPKLIG